MTMLDTNEKEKVLKDIYLEHESEIVEIKELLEQAKCLSDVIYEYYIHTKQYKIDNVFDDRPRISNDIINNILLKLIDKVDSLDKSLNVIED